MPRWSADEDFSAVAPGAGFTTYDGPTPPPGTYRFKLKSGVMKINSKNKKMMTLIFEVDEPKKSAKAKYNGAALFWNGNYTPQGAAFLNAMAEAVGFNVRALYTRLVLESLELEDNPKILKIGSASVGGQIVNIKVNHRDWNGEARLNAQVFFPVSKSTDEEDEEADARDDDEGDEEDYDDEPEDEEDEDEDDEEEPPPPPRKRPAKKAPAKTARRRAPEPEEDDEDDEDEDDEDDDAGF